MNEKLYEFLKSKGLEFCYAGKEPVLVNSYVDVKYIQEYADLVQKEIIISEVTITSVDGFDNLPMVVDELSKDKPLEEINFGVFCGHRFYPNDDSVSVPVKDTRSKQEVEKFVKKQTRINNAANIDTLK